MRQWTSTLRFTTYRTIGALLVLTFALAIGDVTQIAAQQRVSLQGYGEAKFGMRVDEVGRAVGRTLAFDQTHPGGRKTYIGPAVRVRHLMFDTRYVFDGDGRLFLVNLEHPMETYSFERCQRLFEEVSRMVSDRYGAPTRGPRMTRVPFERAENLVWTTSKGVARYDLDRDSGVVVRMAHHDFPRLVGLAELQCHVFVQYGTAAGGSEF